MKAIQVLFLIFCSIFISFNTHAIDRKIQADIINPSVAGNAVNAPKIQVDNVNIDANTVKSTTGDLIIDSAGTIKPNQDIVPNTTGIDLGSSANRLQNIYTTGEHFGLRIENVTSGTIPASSSTTKGKLVYTTDTKKLYVDDGTNYIEAGGSGGGISEWLTGVNYTVGSIAHVNNKIYKTLIAHTAGTFATDLAAAKWVELSADSEAILSRGQSAGSAVSTKEIQAPLNQVTDLGSGVSLIETGNLNVLKDPSSEAILTSWSVYKNSVVASSPDLAMAGSTAANNLQVSNSTSSPLEGTRSLLLVKQNSVNAQGEGIKIPFTIPAGFKYKMIRLSFLYQVASGTYTDDQIEFFIKDVTNGTIKPLTPSKIKNHTLPSDWFNPNGEYQTSDSTSYELIAHVAGTSSQNYSLRFDLFKLGIQERTYGSVVTDWKAYTPTVTNLGAGSVSASAGFWRQVGDTAEIMFNWTKDGTPGSGASQIYVSLPPGLSVNLSKFPAGGNIVGDEAYSTINKSLVPVVDGTGNGIYLIDAIGGSAITGSSAVASSNFRATVKVPIAGWGTTQQLSSEGDGRVTALMATGTPVGTVNASVNSFYFPTISTNGDTHGSYGSNGYLVKSSGWYYVDVKAVTTGTYTAGSSWLNLTIDVGGSTKNSQLTFADNTSEIPGVVSGLVYANAGQYITTSSSVNTTSAFASTIRNAISIFKISGNQQSAASDSVSALYTGNPPTGTLGGSSNLATYGTKVKDSHNAYSAGIYTVPVSGTYDICAAVSIGATFSAGQAGILIVAINGVDTYQAYERIEVAGTVNARIVLPIKSVPLLAGQTVSIRTVVSGSGPVFESTPAYNYFSISRSGNY